MNTQDRMLKWYDDSLKEFGTSDFRSLTWGNAEGTSAKFRYEQMNSVISFKDKNIIEFGCGWGSFFDFGFTCKQFVGIDISKDFISLAVSKYPEHQFINADILDDVTYGNFDIAISSGVAGNQGGPADHPLKLYNYLKKMLAHANTVLVNFPSTWSTIRSVNIEYFSPASTLDIALTLTPNVRLYHKNLSDFLLILEK